MAADWIKMRSNLWDDPRVSGLCDSTGCGEAQIVGALYWLWASADQHTEDGTLPGLTLGAIDRKTGVPGLAAGLVKIGWLEALDEGVRISRFSEHNGASAKRRSSEAKRKGSVRKVSASYADKMQTECGQNAPICGKVAELEKEKEKEKEREEEQVQKQKPRAARSPRPPAIVVEDVPEQLLTDYLAIRKAKNVGPLTATALEQLRREARKAGITLEAAMTACCGYGWAGFNHRWYLDRNSGRTTPANARQVENDRRGDEFLRLIGAPGSDPNTIDMES